MTDEDKAKRNTLISVIQHMETVVVKQAGLAKQANAKGLGVRASQHAHAAKIIKSELEWLQSKVNQYHD